MFTLRKQTRLGRRGTIQTLHGAVETPFFLPVATAGAMKGITLEDLITLGADILLSNTYHLHLQPGEEIIREAGGLHHFMGWDKPILTDSGGFQVFSLKNMRRIAENGVHFQSHINGDPHFIGPEESIRIQHALGSDIILCFDECPPSTAPRTEIEKAVDRTLRWAKECKKLHDRLRTSNEQRANQQRDPLLFAVVQGGLDKSLRTKCAEELMAIGFDGYAIGGLAVGETPIEMMQIVDLVCPLLPENAPRYLMGVGEVDQMREAIAKGIDMFDCVLPMREARHGLLLLSDESKIRIDSSAYRNDHSVIDPDSPSSLSRTHMKSYLCHLFKAKERLAETIACMQNMGVTLKAIQDVREAIEDSEK